MMLRSKILAVGRWVAAQPRRHPATYALLLVCAVFIFGLNIQARESAARRTDLCRGFNRQQAVIAELVKVATDPIDPPDLSALTNLPEFKALDANDRAFWLIVLNSTSGGGTSPRSTALIEFARTRLQPAECSTA